jgi:uncharacterized membrane protein YhaH (DUF805 family)
MNMLEAVTAVFRKYADFSGRARRSEYWYPYLTYQIFTLTYIIFTLAISSGFSASEKSQIALANILLFFLALFGLGAFLPMLAVQVRRLHDIDKSGWNILWFNIPIVGSILMIVWGCRPGTVGDNRYGPDPLAPAGPEAG